MRRLGTGAAAAIFVLLTTLLALRAASGVAGKSATVDEPLHLVAGYLHLADGEFHLNPVHPPLIKMLAALPLLAMEVRRPPLPERWDRLSTDHRFVHDFLYRANDADRLLARGRFAVLPLALVLGFFVFLWARRLFGLGGASLALGLYSFDPNVLAHAPLVHTDMGVTCFLFASTYFVARLLEDGVSVPRVLLAALAWSLAMASKFSAVWTAPWLVVLGALVVASRHPLSLLIPWRTPLTVTRRTRKLLVVLAVLLVMAATAYAMIWTVYLFRFDAGIDPGYEYVRPWEEVVRAHSRANTLIVWARDHRLLPDAYLYGLAAVSGSLGRPSFLMGEVSERGWWHYFAVTFLLKTPLAFLLMLALAPLALRPWWRTRPLALACLLVPPLLYFAVASASRLNIGHRHILPIYPFLFVLAGALLPWCLRQRAIVQVAAGAAALWYAGASASIAPHYLAYFNELAGGPDNGYRYLVDSNLDWGQDLKSLKRYMDQHGIERVWLSYFGTASPSYYGIAYNYLPSWAVFEPDPEKKPTPWVAVSATNLWGYLLGSPEYMRALRTRPPRAKIGYSIFLYRLHARSCGSGEPWSQADCPSPEDDDRSRPALTVRDTFRLMAERFRPDKAPGLDATVQFDIGGGEGGGTWHAVIRDGTCRVAEGPASTPTLTVQMTGPDWLDMLAGERSGHTLFMTGRLRLKGNMWLAVKLRSFFQTEDETQDLEAGS